MEHVNETLLRAEWGFRGVGAGKWLRGGRGDSRKCRKGGALV